ncbi:MULTISPECIES: sacsin N-terminal ATP-binding-like domain-containing protein [unclassified Micromonospora]|uniref:sacsin N-terminal ATP-binding-like domain-containing protein n=1 Tax=unclassified Micromonospora TaxID=2617518 RepID=UPI00364207F0
MSGFRNRVIRQADSIAELYLEGERLGQPATREQKEFIQGVIAADYDGRTVVELLQNGHDAHLADRRDGRIEFLFAEDEHKFGVLYVANGGQPVSVDDFDSMCRIAMSSKRPDQGIGNKGVGFKSVLQLSDSPEVYSRSVQDSPAFDGFCFRFARPADFDALAARVAPRRPDLAEALRANVSPLKVTIPMDEVPAHVAEFERDGFSTVVRLVLRSTAAQQRVREQLAELSSSDVPFNLFLERVGRIAVRTRTTAGVESTHLLTRSGHPLAQGIEEVRVDDGAYLLLRRTVPEAEMTRIIRQSRDANGLNSGWERWRGDAAVCVAVPLDRPVERGRLYTFLPMGEAAQAPMPAFVNAPFFAQLDRRSLSPSIPLNSLLLTEVARLCARAATDASGLPGDVVLDLVCWTSTELPRLRRAFDEIGVDPAKLPLVPALGPDRGRTALAATRLWAGRGSVFTAEAVAAAGSTPIVDTSLHTSRRSRLSVLARDLGVPLQPGPVEVGAFAEAVAEALAARSAAPEVWAGFYDDLEAERLDDRALRQRRILIDDEGKLLAPGGERSVFVRSADDDSTGAHIPPAAVRTRLAFMLAGIPWLTAERRRRPGRVWLDAQNLVREYRTDTVLSLIGSAMQAIDAGESETLRQCLEFAFEVWRRAPRDVSPEAVRDARLRVPAKSGWKTANTTYFGFGWGGTSGETDTRLAQLVAAAGDASVDVRGIGDATIDVAQLGDIDVERWRSFLEAAGVRHGLMPILVQASRMSLSGSQVANPETVGHLPVDVSADDQRRWREVAVNWQRSGPCHQTVQYRPESDVAILPGQRDWSRFDVRARRLFTDLILRGLGRWPDSVLEIRFARDSDPTRPAWPTFVAAFLATAEWIPQTAPGDRTRVSFVAPDRAWWLQAAETPDYLPAPPSSLRGLATPRVLARLARVGVRFWDDPATARNRLDQLTDLVARHRSQGGGLIPPSVRKAYEEAWEDLGDTDEPPQRIVVVRQAQLDVTDLNSAGEPVYVCDETGVAQERLLAQTPIAMLAIRKHRLATQVHDLLQGSGPRRLVRTSTVIIDITADGQPAADLTYRRLDDLAGRWLHTLVLGAVEFQQNSFLTVSSKQLATAARQLSQCELAAAGSIVASVGGHPVGAGVVPRSFLMNADGKPRIVVAATDSGRWTLLSAASGSLAELVGFPQIERFLELALIDLHRICGDRTPAIADIAQALRVPVEDLRALVLDGTSHLSDHFAVVAVLAVIDIGVAEELRDRREPFDGRDDLRAWLSDRGIHADTALALADEDDLHITIEKLNVTLATANEGLRAVGLAPLHNGTGHARQFAAHLQRHRTGIQDKLRDRYLAVAERGEPLTDYLRLRDLPDLGPDPEWLDSHWEISEPLLQGRTADWLDRVSPAPAPTAVPLPSVNELREVGQRTATRVTAAAKIAVEAWLHRSATTSNRRPGAPESVAAQMAADGSMDFRRLTQAHVISWLYSHSQWPEPMQQEIAPTLLGLSPQDLTRAQERLTLATEQQHQISVATTYGTKKFGHEPEETQAFINTVRSDVPAEVLATPPLPSAPPTTLPREPTRTGGSSLGGGWRATTAPPEVTARVGLAGELLVGEWIQHRFGYPPETTWKSGYRRIRFPDDGDDGLGYDFLVNTTDKRILIEVKATTDITLQITLGESEVRRAQALAADEEYLIAFVTDALDPVRRRLHILPNPLATGGFEFYRVAGRSMRLQFRLPTR